MRFRTGRFEKLRLHESGQTQSVKPCQGQYAIEQHATIAPPAAAIARYPAGDIVVCTQGAQFSEHSLATFPLLELDSPQAVTHPLA
jgi:hypothetical protein